MSAAALALAAALLIWPSRQRRLRSARRVGRRRTWWPLFVVCVGAVAWLVPVPVALAAGVVAATVAVRRRDRAAAQRSQHESSALQGALDVLVGELRVGAHPVDAFGTAAGESGGPVAEGMRAVAARARLGADVAAGLDDVARTSELPGHWERLSLCWRLAQTHGLAIGTLMRAAHEDIVERERFSARVRAAMAGPRTTAQVLAGLPLAGIALGQAIGAAPVAFLVRPGAGTWLLVVGVVLACAGLLWSDRILAKVTR
ncbi:type II secretion system F family protein [Mycolicibacterium goodii]|uniref:type II secretion system F family protein n=1 Tax=Mycolicibacterium goodii TaxID=134601 RepID=UPI001F037E2F|nr:type II secretion system F family protein [Mycolicibacterium goodii]ULN47221.1 type II secretion system F family protein [Mycolicibacterium goodii]